MYLKTLTVRGFKSFASATTFHFEPGVTAVVGPNGSGKSNVVDALAWVMGEQGAKNLRGGKMEDVIFAGTSGRSPLGRAQVSLTIDNSDGALPIEFSEVTISRTLFRSGGSEYAINGASCRLLDIQELLSDSGLGREMHVIVGQGQLDRILQASPEERRGFIDEASGVLKHRRRKERSVRKLEAMRTNLDRVRDLAEEVRRQLGPLSRQAATARKARRIQYDVRDARTRLLADDVARQREALERLGGDGDLAAALAAAQETVAEAERRAVAIGAEAATAAEAAAGARDHWFRLSTLAERYRSALALSTERGRARSHPVPAPTGPDPQTAQSLAERAGAEAAAALEEVEESRRHQEEASAARTEAEDAARSAAQAHTRLLQAAAERRQQAAVTAGRLEAAITARDSLRAQSDAAEAALTTAQQDAARLRDELAGQQESLSGSLDSEETLDAAHEQAAERAAGLADRDRALLEELTAARTAAGAAAARLEALREGLEPESGAAVGHLTDLNPVQLAEVLSVEGSWQSAVAAALGGPGEQLVVPSRQAVVRAAERLSGSGAAAARLYPLTDGRVDDAGRSPGQGASPAGAPTGLPAGAVWAPSVIGPGTAAAGQGTDEGGAVAAERIAGLVRGLLADTVFVAELEDAEAAAGVGALRIVTRDGHVVAPGFTDVPGAGGSSRLERQAAADSAQTAAASAAAEVERLEAERGTVRDELAEARQAQDIALAALEASDARFSAATQELSRLQHEAATAEQAVGRQREVIESLSVRLAEADQAVEVAAARAEEAALTASEGAAADGGGDGRGDGGEADAGADGPTSGTTAGTTPDPAERDAAEERAGQARHAETEARLALRAAETAHAQLTTRAEQASRQVAAARLAAEEHRRAEQRRIAWLTRIEAVTGALTQALTHLEEAVARADRDRASLEERGTELARERQRLQAEAEGHRGEVARVRERLHAAEMARQEQQLRLDQLIDRAREDLGMTGDYLVEHYGPHAPVPASPDPSAPDPGSPDPAAARDGEAEQGAEAGPRAEAEASGETEPGTPYDRAEQEKRLRRAERELAALGRVNPLALEEYSAVEERHRFLSGQLEDLDSSRRDLLQIIRDVDETVLRVFKAAFEDTAEQFQHVFATLFPGGEGRLYLTDPDNLLETGVEVEARPAGKKVKRLSLLSGGERSLAAVAMLVAIFKARPSPFYVMDEVEAALDDTNLGRLLEIFRELQQDSQLIIITHQKRTMEVADALYGVSMRGDGVSTVISQRLGDARPGPDPAD